MPSSTQRLEVWRGLRAKTSGGLTKADLVKNKRGKIVSKKKSTQAFQQNNLGDFLRKKGTKVPKDEMLYKKGQKKPSIAAPKKPAAPKVQPAAPKKAAAAPKKAQPAAPKKAAAAPKKVAPKKVAPKKKVAKKPLKKKATNPKINPITKQPYAKKTSGGYVAKAAVHVDNIKPKKKKKPAKTKKFVEAADTNFADFWDF